MLRVNGRSGFCTAGFVALLSLAGCAGRRSGNMPIAEMPYDFSKQWIAGASAGLYLFQGQEFISGYGYAGHVTRTFGGSGGSVGGIDVSYFTTTRPDEKYSGEMTFNALLVSYVYNMDDFHPPLKASRRNNLGLGAGLGFPSHSDYAVDPTAMLALWFRDDLVMKTGDRSYVILSWGGGWYWWGAVEAETGEEWDLPTMLMPSYIGVGLDVVF